MSTNAQRPLLQSGMSFGFVSIIATAPLAQLELHAWKRSDQCVTLATTRYSHPRLSKVLSVFCPLHFSTSVVPRFVASWQQKITKLHELGYVFRTAGQLARHNKSRSQTDFRHFRLFNHAIQCGDVCERNHTQIFGNYFLFRRG